MYRESEPHYLRLTRLWEDDPEREDILNTNHYYWITEDYEKGWAAEDDHDLNTEIYHEVCRQAFELQFHTTSQQDLQKYATQIRASKLTQAGWKTINLTYGEWKLNGWQENGWGWANPFTWNLLPTTFENRRKLKNELLQQTWWRPRRNYTHVYYWKFIIDRSDRPENVHEVLQDPNMTINPKYIQWKYQRGREGKKPDPIISKEELISQSRLHGKRSFDTDETYASEVFKRKNPADFWL